MMKNVFILMFSMPIILTGCATPPPPPKPQNLIAASLVINSVKCGLALALHNEQNGQGATERLTGNVASLELKLKVVDKSTTTGQAEVSASVVAWKGGGFGIGGGGSRLSAWTVETLINATYKLDATNFNVCFAAGIDPDDLNSDRFGFSRWLGDVLSDLSRVSLEKPTGTLDKLTYDASFGVTEKSDFGGKLQLAFLSANASLAKERVDLQQLKIVISPQKSEGQSGGGSSSTGGSGTALGPLQNLSDAQASE